MKYAACTWKSGWATVGTMYTGWSPIRCMRAGLSCGNG